MSSRNDVACTVSDAADSADAFAISCDGVGKVFRTLAQRDCWRVLIGDAGEIGKKDVVLEDVSIDVRAGTFVGIMGANGAGKSTLLRVLGGVLSATQGVVRVCGDLTGIYELGPLGDDRLSGREYASRYLAFQGTPERDVADAIDWVKSFSELEEFFELPIFTYSSGMKARLFFSVATACPHDVYLIDEAISVGDEHFTSKCWRHMRRQVASGATGLLVSQSWDSVLSLCSEMHVMDKGRIIQSGPTEKLVPALLPTQELRTDIARFHKSLNEKMIARTGHDARFEFPVEASMTRKVRFGFSIDVFRPGFGWVILLLRGRNFIELGPGLNMIRVSVPDFPLVPGKYAINVALADAFDERDGYGARVMLDHRNWSLGNQLELNVTGPDRKSAAVLPMKWKFQETG